LGKSITFKNKLLLTDPKLHCTYNNSIQFIPNHPIQRTTLITSSFLLLAVVQPNCPYSIREFITSMQLIRPSLVGLTDNDLPSAFQWRSLNPNFFVKLRDPLTTACHFSL
jgi:hypothetical protein